MRSSNQRKYFHISGVLRTSDDLVMFVMFGQTLVMFGHGAGHVGHVAVVATPHAMHAPHFAMWPNSCGRPLVAAHQPAGRH